MADTVWQSEDVLAAARTVLVVDWPTEDVPESLARAGIRVVVRGGPRPDQYTEYDVANGEIVVRPVGRAPEQADLVYSFRPVDELPTIVALAQDLGARAVWVQSGMNAAGTRDETGCALPPEEEQRARRIVESAGLRYIDSPYIGDAVRRRRPSA